MNGQTMLQFVLVAPLFFFLVFAVINAVQEAGRFAPTGNYLADPDNPGQTMSRVGQVALLKFGMVLVIMLAPVDFGRAINYMQVMLSRQRSNLASRCSGLSPSAATVVVAGDAPLDSAGNGEVIVIAVTNVALVNLITGQAWQGYHTHQQGDDGSRECGQNAAVGGWHAPAWPDHLRHRGVSTPISRSLHWESC
jgi:hypothetical protein